MSDDAPDIGAYLSELPDSAFVDLHELAGSVLSRWPRTPDREIGRGISISVEITRARLAKARSARQDRVEGARAAGGSKAAADLIAREWATHNGQGGRASDGAS